MSKTDPELRGPPDLAGDFEGDVLDSDPGRLEGTWVRFQSRNQVISGEVIEVYDDPQGVRRISIEKDSGVVRAIPLWFLDGIYEANR